MDNYQKATVYARGLFLRWDQESIIRRCRLQADEDYIYLSFLASPYRIARSTGVVECVEGAVREADFSESLSIYDYICRENPVPGLSGRLLHINSLRNAAKSSPSDSSFHQKWAEKYQQHLPALQAAVDRIGVAAFPQGDISCMFSVFDGFTAVFQFWEGDEEFPPSVRFLWDENTPDYLKYETTYYVMGCFLRKLDDMISDIERNC